MPQEASVVLSFRVDPNEELVQGLKTLAARDDESLSEILRKAAQEYVKRHSPGNSQLILGHWSENVPFPITLQERCEHEFGLVEVPDVRGAKWTRCLKCGAHP